MKHPRAALGRAQRVVVKIGSRALAGEEHLPARISSELAALTGPSRSFLVVSSGAIAIGCQRLGYRRRPREMAKLQAAAAAGQSILMQRYTEALHRAGLSAAQVLLTHADLSDRVRLNNAREALGALLEARAVPVINENDTVATDEIRFGDNDQLASMVVPLVGADLLILLTDVEGVLDPQGERIGLLDGQRDVGQVRSRSNDAVGTGGMTSKLEAAYKASRSGASVVIAPAARDGILGAVLSGEDVGSLLPPHESVLKARKHWIAYTLRPRGAILIDAGAAEVLGRGRSSLLPVGVLGVRGLFSPGDSVRLLDPSGLELGRGLARMGAMDVARAAGKTRQELALLSSAERDAVVVHKDDLVLAR